MTVPGLVDPHFHLLPGIDDGAQSLQESVTLLRLAHAGGVRHVVATPHMFAPPWNNVDPAAIREAFRVFKDEVEESSRRLIFLRDMKLSLGAENYVSTELFETLAAGEVITLNDSDHLLIEFSGFLTLDHIFAAVERIKSAGLHPVVAHVERYPVFQKDWRRLEALARAGCLLQVNASSVTGADGRRVRRFCDRLLRRSLVHLVASDAHDARSRGPALGSAFRALAERFSDEDAVLLTKERAEAILGSLRRLSEPIPEVLA